MNLILLITDLTWHSTRPPDLEVSHGLDGEDLAFQGDALAVNTLLTSLITSVAWQDFQHISLLTRR